jgi:hypothetical protein
MYKHNIQVKENLDNLETAKRAKYISPGGQCAQINNDRLFLILTIRY